MEKQVSVAVAQVAPVALDRGATTERVTQWIGEAGRQGAQLVLFPEALIPGYPRGLIFGTLVGQRSGEGRSQFARYFEQSVRVPGPETVAIGEAARRAGCWVAVGVVERATERAGTLYCTLLYFAPDGTLAGRHRKLKPTAAERLIWGEGDGSTLTALDTPFGVIGGLICWENLMPLARMAMYAKGIDIWLAPTADARDSWQATIRHIACEMRGFVLSSNQYVTRAMLPAAWAAAEGPDPLCRGGSAIIGPLGDYLAGPLWDAEGLLTATLDTEQIAGARFDFNVTGHYARPDVFTLRVNEQPAVSVQPEVQREVAAGAAGDDAASPAVRESAGPSAAPERAATRRAI